ncbi:MAG: hypothetical protein SFW35_04225 [Chitinophagales bacterium]|nr:hypothetical protein [Chitinophagales bacterium]
MDAIFKIRGDEFDEALFNKIKALLNNNGKASIVIRVMDEQEVYNHDLMQSIAELEQPEKLISFTLEGLASYQNDTKGK